MEEKTFGQNPFEQEGIKKNIRKETQKLRNLKNK
jgi:hypothetical protein